jgi:hypothetical protein
MMRGLSNKSAAVTHLYVDVPSANDATHLALDLLCSCRQLVPLFLLPSIYCALMLPSRYGAAAAGDMKLAPHEQGMRTQGMGT